jgi:hypothetical protein
MKSIMFGITITNTTRKRLICIFHLCMCTLDEACITGHVDVDVRLHGDLPPPLIDLYSMTLKTRSSSPYKLRGYIYLV